MTYNQGFFGPLALAAGAVVLAVGCSSAPTKPAGHASAGCAQLGNATQLAAPQMNQVYAAREVQLDTSTTYPGGHFEARAIQIKRTDGADLYVHATPGTTKEYLERTFTCHAAEGQALSNNDPFHPSKGHVASVDVRKAGAGFAVRVLGSDAASSKEIWRRAEAMTGGETSVDVEQVAANESGMGAGL